MAKTYQSIVVDAPVERVWASVRDFHDLSWATSVVTTCTAVGHRSGYQIGAKRVLNDAFHETLIELSDAKRTVRYSIDDGPSPIPKNDVTDYVGVLRLHPITESDATFVEWSSSWDGPENGADEFCHGIYLALLDDLRKAHA